jgi:hypothetical protein
VRLAKIAAVLPLRRFPAKNVRVIVSGVVGGEWIQHLSVPDAPAQFRSLIDPARHWRNIEAIVNRYSGLCALPFHSFKKLGRASHSNGCMEAPAGSSP